MNCRVVSTERNEDWIHLLDAAEAEASASRQQSTGLSIMSFETSSDGDPVAARATTGQCVSAKPPGLFRALILSALTLISSGGVSSPIKGRTGYKRSASNRLGQKKAGAF